MSNSQIKSILLAVCDLRVEYVSPSFKITTFKQNYKKKSKISEEIHGVVAGLLNQDKAISLCQFLAEKPNTNVQTRSILITLPRTTSVFSQN
jgi:hypothetical protein